MNKKRKAKSRTKKIKRAAWIKWVVVSGLLVCVSILLWIVYLDVQVRERFDGRKWKLPAQVYAQPLEMYEGQLLTLDELKLELVALDYQEVKRVRKPGEVRYFWGGVEIFSRGFSAYGETEKPQNFIVRIQDNKVQELKSASNSGVSLVRLEPALIGGIYPRLQQDRELVQLEGIPKLLGEAIIAVEDRRFVNHFGVSIKDIGRAVIANVKAGRIVQGGSTLTQQLVKNFYLTNRRDLSRKITEAIMAVLLEIHYSKAEILETYINEVYLGQSGPRQIHGFALASQHYFRRPLGELSVAELSLLVGVVKGASYYNPWRHPERALARRNTVIDILLAQELISMAMAQSAKQSGLGIVDMSQRSLRAYPAFIDLVKRQLLKDYSLDSLSSEGLKIFTTLSVSAQYQAEQSLSKTLMDLEARYKQPKNSLQGAVTLVDVGSGEVEAMVGDRNASFAGFNRALDAHRPIGSLIKPVVYLSALDASTGMNLASKISDNTVTVQSSSGTLWQPRNFDRTSHGDVLLVDALAHSYNQATARLGMTVGLDNVARTMQEMGMEVEDYIVPSTLLGAVEMSTLQVADLYHVLANDGVRVPLRSIRAVENADGKVLSRYNLNVKSFFQSDTIGLIQYALQSVVRDGTGRGLYKIINSDLNVAGKTGTSNDQRDSWFAGFSGQHVGVVWVGRDDNAPTPLTGSSGALKVWGELFSVLSSASFDTPHFAGMEYVWIDARSGGLSGENCKNSKLVPFVRGNLPDFQATCEWRQNPIYHWVKKWIY
jgi:penicillin-binding protein 1B